MIARIAGQHIGARQIAVHPADHIFQFVQFIQAGPALPLAFGLLEDKGFV